MVWTKEIIQKIVCLREGEDSIYGPSSFAEIVKELKSQYDIVVTEAAVTGVYRRNKSKESTSVDEGEMVTSLYKQSLRATKTASSQRKINKNIITYVLDQEHMLAAIEALVAKVSNRSIQKIKAVPVSSVDKKMTLELLISDIQYGQQSSKADGEVFRKRLREVTRATIFKVEQYRLSGYTIEKIIIAILGDIIESAHMHGHDSAVGCEYNTPEQMRVAVESLWYDLLSPLFQLGIPVHVPCVGGNHDRVEEKMMTFETSKSCFSWPIYHGLRLLAEAAGYSHVTWDIAVGVYTTVDIYGHGVVYEHGYKLKPAEEELGRRLLQRMKQLGRTLTYFRMGDMHRVCRWGMDELVVNGSICGDNWYSEGKGFKANSAQLLFSYLERNDGKLPLYESFCIQLEHINKGSKL